MNLRKLLWSCQWPCGPILPRSRIQIALSVALMVLVVGMLWQFLRQTEPVCQGKRLSVWLENYDFPKSEEARQRADEAVRQTGTNAIPIFLAMLRVSDSAPWKRIVLDWVLRQHVIRINHIKDWGYNRRAAYAFGALGGAASNAVPELVCLYEYPISRSSQRWTACALGKIGPSAKMAIPSLLKVANNPPDEDGRLNAVFALGGIHAEPELVIPTLIICLSDPSDHVQIQTIEGLGNFGVEAKTAVPALALMLQNPNRDVVSQARAALRRIDPEAAAKAGVE